MTSYQCQGNKEKHMQKSERYLHKRMSSKKIGEPTQKSKYFNGFNGKQPLQINTKLNIMASHQCQGYKKKTCKKAKRLLNKQMSSKQIGEYTEEKKMLLRQ